VCCITYTLRNKSCLGMPYTTYSLTLCMLHRPCTLIYTIVPLYKPVRIEGFILFVISKRQKSAHSLIISFNLFSFPKTAHWPLVFNIFASNLGRTWIRFSAWKLTILRLFVGFVSIYRQILHLKQATAVSITIISSRPTN
jgi:hypothetical protein